MRLSACNYMSEVCNTRTQPGRNSSNMSQLFTICNLLATYPARYNATRLLRARLKGSRAAFEEGGRLGKGAERIPRTGDGRCGGCLSLREPRNPKSSTTGCWRPRSLSSALIQQALRGSAAKDTEPWVWSHCTNSKERVRIYG